MYYKFKSKYLKYKKKYFDLKSKQLLLGGNYIPKIIHIIWFGDKPDNFFENIELWYKFNLEYEIWLWTDSKFFNNFEDIKLDYLKINLVNSLENYYIVNKWLSLPLEKWGNMIYGAASDIARILIINKHGGYYSDLDNLPGKIDNNLGQKNGFVILRDENNDYLPAFMGGKPNNIFTQTAIKIISNLDYFFIDELNNNSTSIEKWSCIAFLVAKLLDETIKILKDNRSIEQNISDYTVFFDLNDGVINGKIKIGSGLSSENLEYVDCRYAKYFFKVINNLKYSDFVKKTIEVFKILENDESIMNYYIFKINDVYYFLIGEKHQFGKGILYNYIKKLINDCNIRINFYLESFLHYDYLLQPREDKITIPYDDKLIRIDNIRNLLEYRNDQCNNFQVFNTDTRNNALMELYTPLLIKQSLESEININKLIFNTVFEHYNIRDRTLQIYEFPKLNEKNKNLFEKYYKNLSIIKNNKINTCLNLIESNSKDHNKISNEIKTLDSYVIEPYTIIQMMLDSDSKIKFGYYGYMHVERLYDMFFKNHKNIELIERFTRKKI